MDANDDVGEKPSLSAMLDIGNSAEMVELGVLRDPSVTTVSLESSHAMSARRVPDEPREIRWPCRLALEEALMVA